MSIGPTSAIWWTAGASGMRAPAMLATRLDHTPQAITTCSALMVPLSVTTDSTSRDPSTGPGRVVMSSTSVLANTPQPASTARVRIRVPVSRESTTDTVGQ